MGDARAVGHQVEDLDRRVRELEEQNRRLWLASAIQGGVLAVLVITVVVLVFE
jgi:hypothetical protein